MFTGIVEQLGFVTKCEIINDILNLDIKPIKPLSDIKIGDSVSVNGVCLTVTELSSDGFSVQAVPETLRCSNIQFFQIGSPVNLELSMKANTRVGGHFVQGHVDSICEVYDIVPEGEASMITFTLPNHLRQYIINKGYVCIDGMSLTVVKATETHFSITLIPHTKSVTIAQYYQAGSIVNLEVDMIAKYVEKINLVNMQREPAHA